MTITGKIEDTCGTSLHVAITFVSKSTPIVSASGVVTGNTTKRIKSLTDGTFSIVLAAGVYIVTYYTTPAVTSFEITVPDGDTSTTIDEVTSSALTFTYSAPNTVWNGQREGHITFVPIDAPSAPSAASAVDLGGHIVDTEYYRYAVTYETAEGETEASPVTTITGVTSGAITVTTDISQTRVTKKRIWRNNASGTTIATSFKLLTELDPDVADYEDFESHADLTARMTDDAPPDYNTTAGIIYSSPGNEILYFSKNGLRVLSTLDVDEAANFDSTIYASSSITSNSKVVAPAAYFGGTMNVGRTSTDQTQNYLYMNYLGAYAWIEGDPDPVFKTIFTVDDAGTNIPALNVSTSFKYSTGAVNGYVLACDDDGNATWTSVSWFSGVGANILDGATDEPTIDPVHPDQNNLYFGANGTLYGWRANGTEWIRIIG